jgi:MOSC domain-containing protein YiiM
MIITSVNIGQVKEVIWNGKSIETGIYKSPVQSIELEMTDVKNDHVIDRRYHGGIDKACYIYSEDHYEYWKNMYPNLNYTPGLFGENMTVKGLDESKIMIGDIYRIGGATVQVTQPRQPCFKLGIVFKNKNVLKEFINSNYPGVYLKVLEGSIVEKNDSMDLIERQHNSMSVKDIYRLLYDKNPNQEDIQFAIEINTLAESCKKSLIKRIIN